MVEFEGNAAWRYCCPGSLAFFSEDTEWELVVIGKPNGVLWCTVEREIENFLVAFTSASSGCYHLSLTLSLWLFATYKLRKNEIAHWFGVQKRTYNYGGIIQEAGASWIRFDQISDFSYFTEHCEYNNCPQLTITIWICPMINTGSWWSSCYKINMSCKHLVGHLV